MSLITETGKFPKAGEVDILLGAYGGGHMRMIIPVAKQLQARGHKVCIFAFTTAVSMVQSSGLPWFSYMALPQAQLPEVKEKGQELASGFPDGGPMSKAHSSAYLGCNYRDLVLQNGSAKAAEIYQQDGRFAFNPIHLMEEVLDYIQPKVVVTTSSPRSEKALIKAAGNKTINSLCMLDLFGMQEVAWLKEAGFGNELCVLNEGVKQFVAESGRPSDEIIITGNPAFDRLQNEDTIQAGRLLREKKGWGKNGKIVVLYASCAEPAVHPFTGEPGLEDLPRKIEAHLVDLVTKDDKYELIIRRHPNEPQDVKTYGSIHQSTMKDDIDNLMHAVDLVVVTRSTVAVQAALAGRPVLSVECSSLQDSPFGKLGFSTAVFSIEKIEKTLNALSEKLASNNEKNSNESASSAETVANRILAFMR
ncbi:hypothetical protein [Cohaesibacter celericrescens]|uniref:UDP-glycosyltransferase n=1 Tax=Cohaesibacter celericrescens TaxID=2067669 RepID=A0A2N5XUH1_9HYPH|nr:hypothetical protein [Cohaesibacter celericrescens]PLW78139.1 hypothetical protein C0081_05685 [Cohaesibacter celericrescens]